MNENCFGPRNQFSLYDTHCKSNVCRLRSLLVMFRSSNAKISLYPLSLYLLFVIITDLCLPNSEFVIKKVDIGEISGISLLKLVTQIIFAESLRDPCFC